jgi:hypothetical protein
MKEAVFAVSWIQAGTGESEEAGAMCHGPVCYGCVWYAVYVLCAGFV